jgi:hypothetical protein
MKWITFILGVKQNVLGLSMLIYILIRFYSVLYIFTRLIISRNTNYKISMSREINKINTYNQWTKNVKIII